MTAQQQSTAEGAGQSRAKPHDSAVAKEYKYAIATALKGSDHGKTVNHKSHNNHCIYNLILMMMIVIMIMISIIIDFAPKQSNDPPDFEPAFLIWEMSCWLGLNMPHMPVPRATMHAPVRVATSMMASALQLFSAYTSASAKVNRPSASVFKTCA